MPDRTISPAGMRLVSLMVGNLPQSIEDLTEAAGVTRSAVAERLNELVAGGFVRRSVERLPSKGRPRYRYAVTDAALADLFPGDQSLVTSAVWRAIQDIGGAKLEKKVLKRVNRALTDHYKGSLQGRTPAERFRELAEVFREAEGNVVELETDGAGHLVMRRRSCSFYNMFDGNRVVCQIDEKMVSAVVGAPVRRTACRHDGDPCCIFEIGADE